MELLNPLLSVCGIGVMIALMVMVMAINFAYIGRRWLSTFRELSKEGGI